MKKKTFLFLFVFFIIVPISRGDNYHIKDFIPDSLTTWRIMGEGGINVGYGSMDYEHADKNQKRIDFNIMPILSFDYEKIRKKSIHEFGLKTSIRYAKIHSESENNDIEKEGSGYIWDADYVVNYDYVRYIKGQWGVFTNMNFEWNYRKDYDDDEQGENETLEKERVISNYGGAIEPGVKYGRIYSGVYASKGREIINELMKADMLARELTKEEFLHLSRIIMERRAIYHYDDRIKKIEALKEIVGYLKEIGAITVDDITPVLIIEDIYSYDLLHYALEKTRRFGYECYVSFIADCRNKRQETNSTLESNRNLNKKSGDFLLTRYSGMENKNNIWIQGINTGFVFSDIVSWRFFYNVEAELNYKKYHDEDEMDQDTSTSATGFRTKDVERDRDEIICKMFGDFYYQLDSRSLFQLRAQFYYGHVDNEYEDKLNESGNYKMMEEYHQILMELRYQYYLTPKLSFIAASEVLFYKNWTNPDNAPCVSKKSNDAMLRLEAVYYY